MKKKLVKIIEYNIKKKIISYFINLKIFVFSLFKNLVSKIIPEIDVKRSATNILIAREIGIKDRNMNKILSNKFILLSKIFLISFIINLLKYTYSLKN